MANSYWGANANDREAKEKPDRRPAKDFNLTNVQGQFAQVPHAFKSELPIKVQDPK